MRNSVLRIVQPLSLVSLPVLLPQLLSVKRRMPRLPEAAGTGGEVGGRGPRLRLLVVGDSMAAGVGVAHHRAGIAGQLAEKVADEADGSVAWQVVARGGATAESTARKVARDPITFEVERDAEEGRNAAGAPDLVVVMVGINDLLRYRGLRAWRHDLDVLVTALRGRWEQAPPIAFCGFPPVWRFPALPQPSRAVLGLRALRMDQVLRESAVRNGVFHVPLPVDSMASEPRSFFAEDRFHPSARGYAEMAGSFVPLALAGIAAR
ncbi:SGNH/GDSL hydrolase family protein [Streptomyces buecherae]|uniref:SGNH/GDSL hydrolase family protein n=1 Tax=Streptomyces buecherae TaxID=2763006 RepID=UPI0037B0915A